MIFFPFNFDYIVNQVQPVLLTTHNPEFTIKKIKISKSFGNVQFKEIFVFEKKFSLYYLQFKTKKKNTISVTKQLSIQFGTKILKPSKKKYTNYFVSATYSRSTKKNGLCLRNCTIGSSPSFR